jgi:hypothetical protein
MEPEVIQVFYIYPEGCEDLYRYAVVGELRDVGTNGVTIDFEERASVDESYKAQQTISFTVEEAQALQKSVGLILAQFKPSKEALVQVGVSEESYS